MTVRCVLFTIAMSLSLSLCTTAADAPLFSGPQIGEKLPSFTAQGAYGESEGKPFDMIADADGAPVLLIFVHELTRPGFGLTRTISQFAASRSAKMEKVGGLKVGVIFLTDDMTASQKRMKNIQQHFPKGVFYGISPDGKEGPGAYGLNRNVTLTILVGKDGKVTENLALVQPQLQADGPKILTALVAVTGGGDVPSIEQLTKGRNGARGRMRRMKELGDAGGNAGRKRDAQKQQ